MSEIFEREKFEREIKAKAKEENYISGYKAGKSDVLDKIKAEVQENINYNNKMNYLGIVAGLLVALNIINKYKSECEDKEGDT